MFVELDNQYRFVQYHDTNESVSNEHADSVITITDALYDLLQQKMPWTLSVFDATKIYDVSDLDMFVEIIVQTPISDKERIEQLEQMINLILMGDV